MDTNEENITLDKLDTGFDAIIKSINSCNDKSLYRHILNMGLTPHTEVTMVKHAPMGDPIQIRVRGYELTIRKADASNIVITEIHNAHKCKRKNKINNEIEHSFKGETKKYLNNREIKKNISEKKLKFALIGNQNCGKTTLFNQLTGLNQHVGNFPGVTVERIDGIIKGDKNVTITDLPGIYSLSPLSGEEIVTRDFILNEKPNGIINIIDATNIERNLFLTMQLIELDVPMVIALNMMDEIKNNNGTIDINGLEMYLGVPVIPISASKNEGIDELIEHAKNVAAYEEKPLKLDICEPYGSFAPIHRCIHSIIHLIDDHAKLADIPTRFAATKLVEDDELILKALNLNENEVKACSQIISQMEEETKMDRQAALSDMKFSFIEKLCDNFVVKPQETKEHKISLKADEILTGKWSAIIAFFAIMAFIFYMTFGPFGTYLSDLMNAGIENITKITDNALTDYGLNPVIHSLVTDGIFAGVGGVLAFLPIIVVLFFFLSILEDTGYMARVAFIMDKALRKIGLSGRSFVPMLIGFGCSVPAIMATRTLPSEKDRKMTILLTPFMSCSAKLPIYALFTAAFFKENQVLVILSLYLIGIVVGIIFAYTIKIFTSKSNPVPFVMELPNYKMPNAKSVLRLIWLKSKGFITKAFTIIFFATIMIWFLQTFDTRLNLVQNSSNSILAMLGNIIAPIFKPIGISDWRISTAFITGFMAKESVISTLTVLLDGDAQKLPELFSKHTAFVFLVFSLLYTPCAAAIATVKRELGKMYAIGVILFQCSIAWFVSYIVYLIGSVLF